ncbi:MAG: hypothetical protein J6D25_05505 [Eggerthellaceae bacterium]|nr:hypothetical protein [Eggerthellaceae bacterium]
MSDTLIMASFAFGMFMPSGISTSMTFTTPFFRRRLRIFSETVSSS